MAREPSIPIYLGLSIHTKTKYEKFIEKIYQLRLSISYDRVLWIENCFGHIVRKEIEIESQVYPGKLQKGIYTVGALANVDHNPSLTTAKESLHGNGINIMQSSESENEEEYYILPFKKVPTDKKTELPDKFTVAKAVSINQQAIEVPLTSIQKRKVNKNDKLIKEIEWLDSHKSNFSNHYEKGKGTSWGVYHASRCPETRKQNVIILMLCLFCEKANSPAIIKHGMNIL